MILIFHGAHLAQSQWVGQSSPRASPLVCFERKWIHKISQKKCVSSLKNVKSTLERTGIK